MSQIQSDCGLSDTFPQGLFPDNPIVSAPFSCWTLSWAIFWILRVFRTDYNPPDTDHTLPTTGNVLVLGVAMSGDKGELLHLHFCFITYSLTLGLLLGLLQISSHYLQFLLSIFVVNMSTLSSEKVISRDSNPGPLSLYLNVLPLHHWPDQRHTTPLPVLDRS